MARQAGPQQKDRDPSRCPANIEMYKCPTCPFNSNGFIYMKKHINEFHAKDSKAESAIYHFLCKNCHFETCFLLNWYKHIMNRHKNQIRINLIRNLKTKMDLRKNWFGCDQCEYKTKSEKTLELHVLRRHLGDDEIQWFYCKYCQYRYKTKHHLRIHSCIKHLKPTVKFTHHLKCDLCEFKTTENAYLRLHFISKHLEKETINRFHCMYCKHQSTTTENMENHMNGAHPEVIWIKCDQCEGTNSKENLEQREYCDFRCKTRYQIYEHVKDRRHCEYKSQSSKEFVSHVASEHEEKVTEESHEDHSYCKKPEDPGTKKIKWFQCGYCDLKSTSERSLMTHLVGDHHGFNIKKVDAIWQLEHNYHKMLNKLPV